MRIQTVAVMSFWALCAICGMAEVLQRDWSHDINDMRESFEKSLRDVVHRRWRDRFVERDFFEHILNLPVSTNTTCFDLRMAEKRQMLKRTQDSLDYCKTNQTAFLLLAVHLGLLMEIPTNTWYTEGMHARMEEDKETEKRLAQKGLSPRRRYTGGGFSGPYINAWERRWGKIRSWNRVLHEYRRGVLEDVRENICNCELHLDWRDAKNLRYQFTRIARLTEEEKELVFGSLQEKDIGASGSAATNTITNVPSTNR